MVSVTVAGGQPGNPSPDVELFDTVRSQLARAVAPVTVLLLLLLGAAPVSAMGSSGDPLQAKQWALTQIGAPTAWASSTGKGVTIGIVDTGVDLTHEDLAEK